MDFFKHANDQRQTVLLVVCFFILCEIDDVKQRIRTHPRSGISSDYLCLCLGVDFNRKWHQFHERVRFWGVGFIFKGKGSKLMVGVQLDFEP